VIDPAKVVTNIVMFDVQKSGRTAAEISAALRERSVLANPTGKYQIRMVTHCDVDRNGIERALAETNRVMQAKGQAA